MRQFRHKNLLSCENSFTFGTEAILILPWMTFGSVRDLLDSHFPLGLPEIVISSIVRDVLEALQYLHERVIKSFNKTINRILINLL